MNVLEELANLGFEDSVDPWEAVTTFEGMLAFYANSAHCVVVDSCSNALFLCMKYLGIENETIAIPGRTYSSVPMQIIHAGNKPEFTDLSWDGKYHLGDTGIVDAATMFSEGMYEPSTYMCTSFHHRKTLKLGRGGCIFTDDPDFVTWCKPMIYDGRDYRKMYSEDDLSCIGYHMYMTPEDAVRGMYLLRDLPPLNPTTGSSDTYKDLSKLSVFGDYV
jgi:dTDP-4-amino-4,6-dideoxygalactose transaminase